MMPSNLTERARLHAALGEETRLAIVELLLTADLSPAELRRRFHVESNLLTHHLNVLEDAGLLRRVASSGDRRRRYLQLIPEALAGLSLSSELSSHDVLFVCTQNSARSQLAAALWNAETGGRAESAGTHPARRIHPLAVAVASRHGINLSDTHPRELDQVQTRPDLVITVCDEAHEELAEHPERVPGRATMLHWSVPDPVEEGTARAFSRTFETLRHRITSVAPSVN